MNTHEKVIMSAIIYLSLPPAETYKAFKQKSQMHKGGGGRGRWRWAKGGNMGVPAITSTLRIFNEMSLWDNT